MVREKIVLMAATGFDNDEIARCLRDRLQVRKRFFEEGLAGFE